MTELDTVADVSFQTDTRGREAAGWPCRGHTVVDLILRGKQNTSARHRALNRVFEFELRIDRASDQVRSIQSGRADQTPRNCSVFCVPV